MPCSWRRPEHDLMTAESHDVFTRMLHWLSGVLVAVA
jgi:hypothetical protein